MRRVSEQEAIFILDGLSVMRQVGDSAWCVYLTLLTLADDEGVVSTSQTELAEQTGMAVRTLQKRIDVLTEMSLVTKQRTFEGVRYVVDVKGANPLRTYMRNPIINNMSLESKDVIKEMGTRTERRNGTEDVFRHWLAAFKERYDVDYRVANYGREKGQLKTLLTKYDGDVERLKAIIDVVMRLYDAKWKSGQYLRPTLGAFCSWLAAQAEAYVQTSETTNDVQDVVEDDDPFAAHDAKFGLDGETV